MKCSAFAFCVFWANNAVSINNSKNKQKDISCHFKKKKIQIHLSHRGAHAKPIPGWKVRQMSLEHTHTKSRSDWLNFCNNSIRIYILSWGGRFQPTLLFHIWEALWHFVTTPMSQKLRLSTWPNVPKVQHKLHHKVDSISSIDRNGGFSVKDAINQMLVMNIIISVLSSSSPCCWRLDVNAILAEVFLLLIIIILLSWRFAIFFW